MFIQKQPLLLLIGSFAEDPIGTVQIQKQPLLLLID